MLNALHEFIIYNAEKGNYETSFNDVDFRSEHGTIYNIMELLLPKYDCELETRESWMLVPSNWGIGEKLRKFKSYKLKLRQKTCG